MIIRFVKKIPLFFVSALAAGTMGFSFHFIFSRYLGPSHYGTYSAIMALMLVFSQPLESLSLTVARTIKEGKEERWEVLFYGFLKLALFVGLLLGTIFYVFSFLWNYGLGVLKQPVIIAACLTIVFWSFLFVFRGFAQGLHKELAFAFNRPLELLGRLCAGFLVILTKGVLAAAILASLWGALAGILHIVAVLKKSLRGGIRLWLKNAKSNEISGGVYFRQFLKILAMSIPLGLFIRLDMILVKKILGAHEAGMYAIANLAGKGVLYYSFSIIPLIYPYLVKHRMGKTGWQFLIIGCAYSSVVFLVTFLVFLGYGKSLIPFFFGSRYKDAALLLPYYIMAIFPIALHCNVINLKLAIGGWKECLFLWTGIVLYFLVLFFSPGDVANYLFRIAFSHLFLAISGIVFLLLREKKIF